MKKPLIFSTGNFHTPRNFDMNKVIELILKLKNEGSPIDGVEICYMSTDEVIENVLDPTLIDEITKTFSHNTIHAPVKSWNRKGRLYYKKDEETIVVLRELYKITEAINAQNINFHPYNPQDPSVFDFNFSHTIENTLNQDVDHFVKKLENLTKFGFLLDVCHAGNDVYGFVEALDSDIEYVHLSLLGDETHRPLHWDDKRKLYLLNLEIIKTLPDETGIVIETHIGKDLDETGALKFTIDDIYEHMQKEVEYVRQWLDN